ncbi:MAG: OmpH family outer membrane protein [Candidatus Lambdaproteobacteria bacterium]|nr:OmpH family outer membrane protein [Candidatus Lambdaproteobacteria bacterium]
MALNTSQAAAMAGRMLMVAALAVLLCAGAAQAQPVPPPLKIGTVELNRALNESKAGQRSKNILLAAKSQKEAELKVQEQELSKLQDDLNTNIMLSKEAKEQREAQLRERQRDLRQSVQEAQRQLQDQERKLTESVISELNTVVDIVSREDKFDIVLERTAAQAILYSRFKFIDITDKVIERYDNLQGGK